MTFLTTSMDIKRPNWDEYFINLCREVGKRSTCGRGRSGAVITKDKRILATGYIGSPSNTPHCDDEGHLMMDEYDGQGNKTEHCVRTLHAEQNAIVQAARFGIPIEGATMYCKMEPCYVCAKMIINAGIKKVVSEFKYPTQNKDNHTKAIFEKAGVKFLILKDEFNYYEPQ